jgi:uncharacterized protein (TIGR02271 family)
MTHTLVAAFDTLAQAQAAKSQLLIQNVLESDIDISSNESAAVGDTAAADAGVHNQEHHESKIGHFFASLFGNDEQDKPHRYAAAYPEAYRRGAALLTVTVATDDQIDHVTNVLERNGAIDIDERSASWGAEGGSYVHSESTHIAGTHLAADRAEVVDRTLDSSTDRTSIPVIEEDLRVGKREINTGRVRVVSRISERPVEETVNLHEEHAHIERHPVDRPATAAELNNFKAASIEIQETAEEVVVEKTARVVEEVSVGKQSSDHQETVRDTVRRTDIDVQSEPGSTVRRDPQDSLASNPNRRPKDI